MATAEQKITMTATTPCEVNGGRLLHPCTRHSSPYCPFPNLVIWPKIFEKFRRIVMGARLIRVTGKLQREGIVIHVIVDHMEDMTDRLHAISGPDFKDSTHLKSADLAYENNLARADEIKSPLRDSKRPTTRNIYPSRDFH